MKSAAFVLSLLVQVSALSLANAAKLVIVTDEAKAVKAQEVAALFRTTAPFSRMKDLNLKVIQTTTAKLGCGVAPPSAFDMVVSKNDSSELKSAQEDDRLQQSEARDRRTNQNKDLQPPSCNGVAPPTRLITCDTVQATLYLNGLKNFEKATTATISTIQSDRGGFRRNW